MASKDAQGFSTAAPYSNGSGTVAQRPRAEAAH